MASSSSKSYSSLASSSSSSNKATDTTSKSNIKSKPENKSPSSPNAKTSYLLLYNASSATLWSLILALTLRALILRISAHNGRYQDDKISVHDSVGTLTRWTQTAALAEIGHAIFGLVRASPVTTAIQVASRLFIIWAIVYPFPYLADASLAYTTMLLAWSVTEVVRYSYFAVLLQRSRRLGENGGSSDASPQQAPPWLVWLRYNLFFVLYPVGILSEMRMVHLAIRPAEKVDGRLAWMLWGVLAVYVPGSYVMVTHMMTQRWRMKRGKGKMRAM